jgi:iron complex outermembrane receptor protein
MSFRHALLASAAAFVAGPAAAAAAAVAESAPMIVTERRLNPAAEEAAAEAAQRPGNVSVVAAEDFEDRYAVTFRDMLQFIPGVIAQPRFGEEVRLSIRGSGVANNAHLRGVELLFDGVPINGADGFGDFQELDPGFASHLTVNRGANAFASGSATLGGSIEMSALRGRDARERAFVRVDGGSFETGRLNARVAGAGDRFDWIVAGTAQKQKGFRPNSEQSNGRLYAQGGWRWTDRIETRVGVLLNDVNQQIPGALTIAQATSTPSLANTGNFNFAFARDIDSIRVWTRTTIDLQGAGVITVGGSFSDRQLYHPISVVIDQKTIDHLAFARWDGEAEISGRTLGWTAGLRWRDARVRALTFVATPNRLADRGALTAASIQRAGGLDAFAELRLGLTEELTVLAGLNSISTDRDVENLRNRAASDGESFDQVSPKFGVVWSPSETFRLFANVSGIYEPPSFGQLTQGGFVTFVPIKAQEGTSIEIGARGVLGPISYDVTVYDAQLKNEFIAFQVSPLVPAATFNTPKSVHRGIEAGVSATLSEDLAGGVVSTRASWTLNDFAFKGDPVYRNNTLAGVPESTFTAELAWDNGSLRIAPSVLIQSDTFVDFANTLKAPGYTTWGLSASWNATETATLFIEGRNLADKAFVSMTSAIANARAPGVNLSVATPGDGRAVYAGVRWRIGAK